MTRRGWIRVERRVFDEEWFRDDPASRCEAWLDLISMASHKPTKVRTRHGEIALEVGQLTASTRFLAERWKWSKSRVSRFIGLATDFGWISHSRGTQQMTITINNYSEFQSVEEKEAGQTAGQMRDRCGTKYNKEQLTKASTKPKSKGASAPSFEAFWEKARGMWNEINSPPGNKQEALRYWNGLTRLEKWIAYLVPDMYLREVVEERVKHPERIAKHICRYLKFKLFMTWRDQCEDVDDDETEEDGAGEAAADGGAGEGSGEGVAAGQVRMWEGGDDQGGQLGLDVQRVLRSQGEGDQGEASASGWDETSSRNAGHERWGSGGTEPRFPALAYAAPDRN